MGTGRRSVERMSDASGAEVAVVIVNYETGAWLERCLRSLERCRGDVSVDVVVIDNASGDGSGAVSDDGDTRPERKLLEQGGHGKDPHGPKATGNPFHGLNRSINAASSARARRAIQAAGKVARRQPGARCFA